MAGEAQLKMSFHVGPLASDNTVYHGIAHGAVPARPMMANYAVLFGTQGHDRSLRCEVEVVRAQTDHLAPEGIERVLEK